MNFAHKILFRCFKKQFVRLAHEGAEKISHMPNDMLEFRFYDWKGIGYYQIKDDSQMPVLRKLNLAMAYAKVATAISEQDITESLKAINEAINAKDEKGKMKPDIAKIGFVCIQLLNRRGRMVVMDHLYELAANYFIRQDEDFGLPSDRITAEKIEDLKQMPIDWLKPFFFEKSINEIFPSAENPDEFFADILEQGKIEAMAYLNTISNGGNR